MRLFATAKDFNWRYTLGELLLIVIGVSIALAVSSWYEDQIDRRTEVEYLERLRAALAIDVVRFTRFERVLQAKANTLEALSTETATSLLSGDADGLMRDLNYSSYKALPESNSATFEELKSTGKLALIRDASLRDVLARYYSGYELMSGILAEPMGPYRIIMRSSLPGKAIYNWKTNNKPIDMNELRSGLEILMSHPDLNAAINSELFYTADMEFYLREYRTQAEELLDLLDAVL
jgi:hypothetical protein